MIYIEQSQKLNSALENLANKETIKKTLEKTVENSRESYGKGIIEELGEVDTTISGTDKIRVSLSIDLSEIPQLKDRTVLACLASKSMTNCASKSITSDITSKYIAPRKIESAFRQLRPRVGQTDAMKECTKIDVDGKPFSWRDAKLSGFSLAISTTKELHSFDSKQISKQKDLLTAQLKKNLAFHIDNTLEDMGITQNFAVKPNAKENEIKMGY